LLINGEVVDVALALDPAGGGNALANAQLSLTAHSGNATIIGSLLVVAHASDGGEGSAVANASADITVAGANRTIDIASGASVSASAFNVRGQHGLAASANAHLRFHGANNITVPHHLTVNAIASNAGTSTSHVGSGHVNAHGSVSFGTAAKNVTLGDVMIDVAAVDLARNGSGGATASANFAPNPSITLNVAGLDIEAEATSAGGHNAFANAYADIHETGIASILDGVTVKATAINGLPPGNSTEPGNATASAHFILSPATKIELGDLTVMANATNYEHGSVHAVGTANLDPATMDLGDVTIDVAARNLGTHGINGAVASAVFSPTVTNSLTLTALDVEADATSAGGHNAFANAFASIDEHQATVSIPHDVTVTAVAHNGVKPGNSTLIAGATADAQLIIAGAPDHIVLGNLTVIADATNWEHGNAVANGSITFDVPLTVALGDVVLDVAARNLGIGTIGGAKASAVFSQGTIPHLSVTGLDIEAEAASHGGHGALANAVANMADSNISILHDVTVRANAFNGDGANDAIALADLDLTVTAGALTLGSGVHVAGAACTSRRLPATPATALPRRTPMWACSPVPTRSTSRTASSWAPGPTMSEATRPRPMRSSMSVAMK